MGLREDALAAAAAAAEQRRAAELAALEQRQAAARMVLGSRLTPAEVDELEVAATTSELVVFTDGTLYLAVRDKAGAQAVCLVEPSGNGGWTRIGDIPNLPALGSLLAPGSPA